MLLTALDFIAVVAAIALIRKIILLYVSQKHRSKGFPHPPGPAGLPFIGHFNFPDHPTWRAFGHLSHVYHSDVVRYRIVGSNVIILNSFESAMELLDKRSLIYSDRDDSRLVMLRDLSGVDWSVAFWRYDAKWRDGRKASQSELHPDAIIKYRPYGEFATTVFLRGILKFPQDLMLHLRDLTASRIVYTAYGIETQAKDDPYIATAERVAEAVTSSMLPGSFLVDSIPILQHLPEWFPGAGFKKTARIWRKDAESMLHDPFEDAKREMMRNDTYPDCAAKSLIERMINKAKDPERMEWIVKSALATMYGAGRDTTTSIIYSFFLAMVLYPDVQRRAQASIDEVCNGRLPDLSVDHDSLPYLEALVKEAIRWNPVLPLNIGHLSTRDDVYKGYYIPSGSLVIANLGAMLHDPTVYPEPEDFNPDRFLMTSAHGSSALDPSVHDPMTIAFGFGRRICPGKFLAYETIWTTLASVLAVVDISCEVDRDGNVLLPSGEYSPGFVTTAKPFPCRIRARSSKHAALVGAIGPI